MRSPALAAAIDAVERVNPGGSGLVSVGYGVAYPFSMIGLVLLILTLIVNALARLLVWSALVSVITS